MRGDLRWLIDRVDAVTYDPRTKVHTAPGGVPVAYSLHRCYRIFGRHVSPHRGCMLR